MRSLLFALLLGACSARDVDTAATPEGEGVVTESANAVAVADTARAEQARGDSARADSTRVIAGRNAQAGPMPDIVRALYVNRWGAQSSRRMRKFIAIADTTEINALVIDMKDEFGLNYRSSDPLVQKNAGNAGVVPNLEALLDTLRAHGILPIARIVVFKDSVAARVNPDHVIRKPDGTPWRDKEGLTWVNPYDREIWEYNFRVSEELVRLGFREIQYDYIRFPEPYRSLPPQVFPGASNVSKPDAIAAFLRTANARLDKLDARTTADIFGLVTTVNGPLEIGQWWEKLAPVTDVLLPMVYPSHYPRGSFGIQRPNAEPYQIIHRAISRARERNEALGITTPEHVRPWLQAFTLGQPRYGAPELEAQKRAVYDAGYEGWVLWSPGSNYDIFLPALEKELVSRSKRPAATP